MATNNTEDTSRPASGKATNFKPSAFKRSQWETVSEGADGASFRSLELKEIAKGDAPQEDPLFERYDELVEGRVRRSSSGGRECSEDGEAEGTAESEIDGLRRNHAEALQSLEAHHSEELERVRISAVQQGRAEAQDECDARLRVLEERYTAIVEDMNLQIREGIEGLERRAAEFALQVAKKLVGTAVEINPEYVLQVIHEAVKLTGGASIKSIRVSPQDMEFIKMLSPERQFKEFDGTWSFQADETIRAGCIVETSAGEVDYDLERAWERIREHVVRIR